MKVDVTVPTRIDLAGSTLDVYPLYLFEDGGLTVNAAIDVWVHVSVEERNDSKIVIRSEDLGVEEVTDLDTMAVGGKLDLVKKALRYYRPRTGLTITTRSETPRGSGLGTSSALLMALSSAMNEINGLGLSKEQIIDLGANIEAQVIGIPTGKQDYFPPLFGGVCAMWFDVDGFRYENLSLTDPGSERGWRPNRPLSDVSAPAHCRGLRQPLQWGSRGVRTPLGSDLVERLNERLVLCFTNISHFSGATNWAMLKRYIEDEGDTVARIHQIGEIAIAMRDSLAQMDFDEVARLLGVEWENRKGLAEGVTTPEINAMIAAAEMAGARASKLCGAGGGGCMITYAEPEQVPAVEQALTDSGATVMPFSVVRDGIRMRRDA